MREEHGAIHASGQFGRVFHARRQCNVVLAHMVNLDEEEVELVLQTGVKIAHCPTTAGWFGYGLSQVSQFPEMIDRGATIGLGCDAETCSNNLDAVRSHVLRRDHLS